MPMGPKLRADQLALTFSEISPPYAEQQALAGICALPFLFRCALHHRLPDRHRYSRLH